jgi:hypothetical protein
MRRSSFTTDNNGSPASFRNLFVFASRRETPWNEVLPYIIAQCAGAVAGTVLAHLMFDLAPLAIGIKERSGPSQCHARVLGGPGLLSQMHRV